MCVFGLWEETRVPGENPQRWDWTTNLLAVSAEPRRPTVAASQPERSSYCKEIIQNVSVLHQFDSLFNALLCFCLLFLPLGYCEYGTEISTETALHLSVLKSFFLFSLFAAQYQKNSADTCPCETPCNLTRYGKELSMVKIPSKGSARYLSRKYDKSEDYIRCDGGFSETKL